jgi:hypothetical protein
MSEGIASIAPAKPRSAARTRLAHAARAAAGLSPKDAALVRTMKANGNKLPLRTLIAARSVKLPVALACALVEQESGGGANVFGHDPTIFVGAGEVTKAKYLAYKAQRGSHGQGGMQGVGPVQLTWYAFQDEADRLGGCWKPVVNMKVGFARLGDLVRRNGLHAGIKAYNGTGPAADAYAASVLRRLARWEQILQPQ